jgi:hypothetical protein
VKIVKLKREIEILCVYVFVFSKPDQMSVDTYEHTNQEMLVIAGHAEGKKLTTTGLKKRLKKC